MFVGRKDEVVAYNFVISDVEAVADEFEMAKEDAGSVVVGAAKELGVGLALDCSPFEACIEAVWVLLCSHCHVALTGA